MTKTKVPEGGKTQPAEPTPVSQLYEVQGKQCRLYTDGWHCTCHQPDCEHIAEAKKLRKEEKVAGAAAKESDEGK